MARSTIAREALLSQLEAARNRFGRGAAEATIRLLDELARHDFRDARPLIRFSTRRCCFCAPFRNPRRWFGALKHC